MNRVLRKAKTYTKLVLILAVALVLVLTIFKNRNHEGEIWFFWIDRKVNILWLLGCTGAGSILCYWVFRTVFSMWRDLREMAREDAQRKAEQEQKRRAAELEEQERRIDDKRKSAIERESGQS